MACILLVEDEKNLAAGISENLLAEGYDVVVAADGEQALVDFQKRTIDLVILDVMLPKKNGYAVCQWIRQQGGQQPILFLTAKNELHERLQGLKAGGDDYLAKPFHLSELLMRVEVLLRRALPLHQGKLQVEPLPWQALKPVVWQGCTMDVQQLLLEDPWGKKHPLSPKEIRLWQLLYQHADELVSIEKILKVVWQDEVYPSSRQVEAFVEYFKQHFPQENIDYLIQRYPAEGYMLKKQK